VVVSVLLPIQTGLAGSILAVITATPSVQVATPNETPAEAGMEMPPVAAQTKPPSEVASAEKLAEPLTRVATSDPVPATQPTASVAPAPVQPEAVNPVAPVAAATSNSIPFENSIKSHLEAGGSNCAVTNLFQIAVSDDVPPSKTNRSGTADGQNDLVRLKVEIVGVPEKDSNPIGFDWVFGVPATNNPPVEITHDVTRLGAIPAREMHGSTNALQVDHPENIVIELTRSEGQAALLEPPQFAALRQLILDKTKGDLLTAPTIVAHSGQQASVFVGDESVIVMGVHAFVASKTNASVNYVTQNIPMGLGFDAVTDVEPGGKCAMTILFHMTSFKGYDKYGKDSAELSVPGGKPLGYEQPHPHFSCIEAATKASVRMGQTLALRGPLWTQTTRSKGHFLFPGKTITSRSRLFIFVTPTVPTAADLKTGQSGAGINKAVKAAAIGGRDYDGDGIGAGGTVDGGPIGAGDALTGYVSLGLKLPADVISGPAQGQGVVRTREGGNQIRR
jgi:hypothetical protein